MSKASEKDFQVAVIGGGVCGLACAAALQKAGISVQVFEAAVPFAEIGAGIGLGPSGVHSLNAMDLLDAVLQNINSNDLGSRGFLFHSGLGEHELVYDYPPAPEDASISMHRAAFLNALVELVDLQSTHFNKRCTSISESPTNPNRLLVHFIDGTTHETDVVLGADGIKSAVRHFVVAKAGEPPRHNLAFSNTVAYRGLIPYAQLEAAGFKTRLTDRPVCFVGPSKHAIVVPIKNGELINVAAFSARYDIPIGSQNLPEGTPWVDQVSREDIQKDFDGWGVDVATLLQLMPEKTVRWSVHVVHPPLETYSKGHVALLGDAAHGMLHHLGAGVGPGLEDALLLVRLLSHPGTQTENLQSVLEAYSTIRRPRAQMVWEASHRAGSVYDHHGPTAAGMAEDLRDLWMPIWRYEVENDFDTAISVLRTNATFSQ
ncbi:salicylate hydroxylase [Dichomitus squalens]|nr:salicylate hydroxylase [Dichomitus squalens]